jgi:hypothetical protein
MKYFMKGVEWLGTAIVALIFVTVLVICIPIAIIGDMMNSKHRRRIR